MSHKYTYRGQPFDTTPKYLPDDEPYVDEDYTPKPNFVQAKTLPRDIGREYLAIEGGNYLPTSMSGVALRILVINSDTTFRISDTSTTIQVLDDGLFLFNALRKQPTSYRTSTEIMNHGQGFHNHKGGTARGNIPTYFSRSIEALDAALRETTGKVFTLRNRHGSGYGTEYRVHPDIGWIDQRNQ